MIRLWQSLARPVSAECSESSSSPVVPMHPDFCGIVSTKTRPILKARVFHLHNSAREAQSSTPGLPAQVDIISFFRPHAHPGCLNELAIGFQTPHSLCLLIPAACDSTSLLQFPIPSFYHVIQTLTRVCYLAGTSTS